MSSPIKRHFRPLIARDQHEPYRAATPLELLFDLVLVIAIDVAAHGFVDEIIDGQIAMGSIQFLMAFFAVWWPWNLFTWFASSFDNDDAAYRINVMVMMLGMMFVAASLPFLFSAETLVYGLLGYLILRLSSAVLWFRVSNANPELRSTARRYALGQIALQGLWAFGVLAITPTSRFFIPLFATAAFLELLVPWYAEKAEPTSWHHHHLIERFGLLNIIVLGEVLLSSTHALEQSIRSSFNGSLTLLACLGMVMTFIMWWLYFCSDNHIESIKSKRSFLWGYGHFLVFAAGTATGVGLEVMVESLAEGLVEHGSLVSLTISIPLGLYVFGIWLVRDRYHLRQLQGAVLPFFSIVIALSGFLPNPPLPAILLLITCLIIRLRIQSSAHHCQL